MSGFNAAERASPSQCGESVARQLNIKSQIIVKIAAFTVSKRPLEK
jgi:hypothetical protein